MLAIQRRASSPEGSHVSNGRCDFPEFQVKHLFDELNLKEHSPVIVWIISISFRKMLLELILEMSGT
jgi:hypothetical protein